jgi:hypothetical protein
VGDDELVSLHREVQEMLAQGHLSGCATRLQIDLERELARACDLCSN